MKTVVKHFILTLIWSRRHPPRWPSASRPPTPAPSAATAGYSWVACRPGQRLRGSTSPFLAHATASGSVSAGRGPRSISSTCAFRSTSFTTGNGDRCTRLAAPDSVSTSCRTNSGRRDYSGNETGGNPVRRHRAICEAPHRLLQDRGALPRRPQHHRQSRRARDQPGVPEVPLTPGSAIRVDGNTLPALVDPCGSRARRVDVDHARQYVTRTPLPFIFRNVACRRSSRTAPCSGSSRPQDPARVLRDAGVASDDAIVRGGLANVAPAQVRVQDCAVLGEAVRSRPDQPSVRLELRLITN